jgi:hypothetical protein
MEAEEGFYIYMGMHLHGMGGNIREIQEKQRMLRDPLGNDDPNEGF